MSKTKKEITKRAIKRSLHLNPTFLIDKKASGSSKKSPQDWSTLPLGSLVYEERPISYGIVQTGEYVPNGVRCIRVTDITNGHIEKSHLITTSEKISQSYKRTILQKGDLVMALRGKIGEIAQIDDDLVGANLTRGVALIAPKKEFSSAFLKQQLSSNYTVRTLERSLNGSALQELSIGVLREIPILVPNNYQEQIAIANLLNTWDKAIDTLTQLIAQKELRKKWLMQQLLTGKKRLKGFKGAWKDIQLSDIFERVTRKNTEGNKNVVTISGKQGFVKQDAFFNKLVASEITENYFLVKRGEFCYNKSYSNGYPWGAIKRMNAFESGVVTTLYICFSLKDKKNYIGDFFEVFFDANLLDKGLTKIAHEGGRAHGLLNVTPSDFFSLRLSVPDKEEQSAIVRVFTTIDLDLTHTKSKLEKILLQKQGLMQMLLTGKKRLKL